MTKDCTLRERGGKRVPISRVHRNKPVGESVCSNYISIYTFAIKCNKGRTEKMQLLYVLTDPCIFIYLLPKRKIESDQVKMKD